MLKKEPVLIIRYGKVFWKLSLLTVELFEYVGSYSSSTNLSGLIDLTTVLSLTFSFRDFSSSGLVEYTTSLRSTMGFDLLSE